MGAALPPEVPGTSETRFDPNDELQFPALLSNGAGGIPSNSILVHASEEPTSSSKNAMKLKDIFYDRVIEFHGETEAESSPHAEHYPRPDAVHYPSANPPDEAPSEVKETSNVSDESLQRSESDSSAGQKQIDLHLYDEPEKLNTEATTISPAQDPIPQKEEVRIKKDEVSSLPSSESFEVVSEEENTSRSSLTEGFDELSNLANGGSSSPVISKASENGVDVATVRPLDLDPGWTKVTGDGLLGIHPVFQENTSNANPPVRTLHTFYMVKIPKPLDTKGRSEVKMAEIVLKEKTEKRDYLNAALQVKKASRHEVIERLKAAREKERIAREALREKRKETDPFHAALNKVKEAGRHVRERGQDLCTSEKELDDRIAALESRIQHDTISLQEEKLILREIRQLNASRDQVCANAVVHAEFQETLGQRDEIQAHLKPLLAEVDQLKKEHQTISTKVSAIEDECNILEEAISQLVKQRDAANLARQEAYVFLQNLYKAENFKNDGFYENRREIQFAKQHASQNNKQAVEDICNAQMERVLGLWIGDANFRAEYVKNNERSTLKRLETLDGRALGPDEEPPLLVSPNEFPIPIPDRRTVSSEKSHSANISEKARVQQVASEVKASPTTVKSSSSQSPKPEVAEPVPVAVSAVNIRDTAASAPLNFKADTEEDIMKKEREAMELKEKIRQQQIAKAKEAEERKRKQAEKNQAKALAWAKKEAERKEKEKERKARKKATSAAATVSSTENVVLEGEYASGATVGKVEASVVEASPSPKDQAVSRRRKKAVPQRPKASKVSIVNLSPKKSRFSIQFWLLMGAVLTLIMIAVLLLYLSLRG